MTTLYFVNQCRLKFDGGMMIFGANIADNFPQYDVINMFSTTLPDTWSFESTQSSIISDSITY